MPAVINTLKEAQTLAENDSYFAYMLGCAFKNGTDLKNYKHKDSSKVNDYIFQNSVKPNQSDTQAYLYFRKSVNIGRYPEALFQGGIMLKVGSVGVKQDLEMAIFNFLLAAMLKNNDAIEELSKYHKNFYNIFFPPSSPSSDSLANCIFNINSEDFNFENQLSKFRIFFYLNNIVNYFIDNKDYLSSPDKSLRFTDFVVLLQLISIGCQIKEISDYNKATYSAFSPKKNWATMLLYSPSHEYELRRKSLVQSIINLNDKAYLIIGLVKVFIENLTRLDHDISAKFIELQMNLPKFFNSRDENLISQAIQYAQGNNKDNSNVKKVWNSATPKTEENNTNNNQNNKSKPSLNGSISIFYKPENPTTSLTASEAEGSLLSMTGSAINSNYSSNS